MTKATKNGSQRGTSKNAILKDIFLWIASDISLKDQVQISGYVESLLSVFFHSLGEGVVFVAIPITVNSYVVLFLKSKTFKYFKKFLSSYGSAVQKFKMALWG